MRGLGARQLLWTRQRAEESWESGRQARHAASAPRAWPEVIHRGAAVRQRPFPRGRDAMAKKIRAITVVVAVVLTVSSFGAADVAGAAASTGARLAAPLAGKAAEKAALPIARSVGGRLGMWADDVANARAAGITVQAMRAIGRPAIPSRAATLIPRYCAGGDEVVEVLAELLQPALSRYFRNLRLSPADVQEHIQQVWLKLESARKSPRGCPNDLANPGGWIAEIVRNVAISAYKDSTNRLFRHSVSFYEWEIAQHRGKTAATLLKLQSRETSPYFELCLTHTMASFPPRISRIANRLVDGMDQASIAIELGIPKSTVNDAARVIRRTLEACID